MTKLFSKTLVLSILGGVLLGSLPSTYADYSTNPEAERFLDQMVNEQGFDRAYLVELLAQVEKKQAIIDAMDRPAEKALTWGEYRKLFIQPSLIAGGVDFWQKNRQVLKEAEATFGVPAEIIVAIIGVETRYGGNMGSYRVIDALSTLAFDYPRRAEFFQNELKEFLLLTREQGKNPLDLMGSYAGAMGLGQFMPSSYRIYASNYDADPFIDIWKNPADAIWSVANYLKAHGWVAQSPIAGRARAASSASAAAADTDLLPTRTLAEIDQLGFESIDGFDEDQLATLMVLEGDIGTEYWLGLQNFYVITRYNRSRMYAMAIFQLGAEVRSQVDVL